MFLDIAFGLLLTFLVGFLTDIEPSLTFLLVGLIGSLWLDMDFVIWVLRGNKLDHRAHQHRDLLHNPLMPFPMIAVLVRMMLGWQCGLLFALTTLTHFIHDGKRDGWGIRVFWPFDYRYLCYRSIGNEPARFHFLTREEQDALCEKYGNRNWLKQTYGTLNQTLVAELICMVISIIPVTIWFLSR